MVIMHMRPRIAGIPWMETGEVLCSRFGQATLLPSLPLLFPLVMASSENTKKKLECVDHTNVPESRWFCCDVRVGYHAESCTGDAATPSPWVLSPTPSLC
jgi:hypothetical protein